MWFWKKKEEAKAVISFILTLAVLSAAFLFCKFSLPQGEKAEYYLHRASSQAKIETDLLPEEFLILEGESVTYRAEDGAAFAKTIMEKLRARVRVRESACGVESYYCYSPAFASFVVVDGEKVNLHLAVGEGFVKVGTPLVFGGF